MKDISPFKPDPRSNLIKKFSYKSSLWWAVKILFSLWFLHFLNNFKFNKKNKNLDTSLSNLHKSNKALEHYIKKNIDLNVIKNKEKVIVSKNFFSEPDEVVFRSLNIVLNSFSDKAKLSRGSKIMNLIKNFKNSKDTYKTTLSGCIFKKVSNTMIISREI